VTLWATGLGESIPADVSRNAGPPSAPPLAQIRETVDVTVDGLSAEVLWRWKAPGLRGWTRSTSVCLIQRTARKVLAISHQATTSRFYINRGWAVSSSARLSLEPRSLPPT